MKNWINIYLNYLIRYFKFKNLFIPHIIYYFNQKINKDL